MKDNLYIDRSMRNKNANAERANIFVGLTNQTQQALTGSVLLISTIFLGLSSPLGSNAEMIKTLTPAIKTILFVSWLLTAVSIVCGLAQIIIDIIFLAESTKMFNQLETIWSTLSEDEAGYNENVREAKEIESKQKLSSSFIPLILQVIFMSAAILLALIVGYQVIFQLNTSPSPKFSEQEKYFQKQNWPHNRPPEFNRFIY